MALLNIIRRVSIFVLLIGLMINGILLLMAGDASATRQGNSQPLALRVQLKDKATADSLVASLKKDRPGIEMTPSISSTRADIEVPTGKFRVAVVFKDEEAQSTASVLKKAGFNVVIEKAGDGQSSLRLNEVFASKAAAEARIREVSNKTNSLVQMAAVEAKTKKQTTVWVLKIVVSDDASFQALREYVVKKQPTAPVEP